MNVLDFEKSLGIEFKNKYLIKEALTHRSYLNENKSEPLVSNERLEFLGDAVLSIVVSNFLFHKFVKSAEGDLTNLRSSLVKTQTLAEVAKELRLGDYLLLSKGEEESGGRNNPALLANTFEALVGAIFIDSGLEKASEFVSGSLLPLLPKIMESQTLKDYKSLLQEKLQAKEKISPIYKVLEAVGPAHERIFTVGVFGPEKLGTGNGHSKQQAEQEAAKVALEKIDNLK